MADLTTPIIVIKKKKGHGGHHGGAWKVAYADFVTAMMALFIVLWLLNASKQVQEAVGGYFKDPRGTAKVVGSNRDDLGISWPSGMFSATLAHIPITVVAATMSQTADVIIISPKSGIKTIAGLAGHSIGYFSPSAKTQAEYVMKKNGVNPDKVSYVDVGTTLVQALLSGKVTAMTGGLANVEAIQTRLAFGEQEPVFTLSSEGFPPYPEFTLIANSNRLKDPAYASMVRTFIKALKQGEQAAEQNPSGALAILKSVTQYTPRFLALSTPESLKLIKPSAGQGWGCLNIPQLQTLANFMTSEKIITGSVAVAKEATNAYNSGC